MKTPKERQKQESDELDGEDPSTFKQALSVEVGSHLWRSHFWNDRLPPRWQQMMIVCASQGMSENETMVNMQVTEPCWLRWKDKSGEFKELLGLCRAISLAWFEAKARENLGNPNFRDKLWAMLVTSRYGDPMKLMAQQDPGWKEVRSTGKKLPNTDDARLDHLFSGGTGFPDEPDLRKQRST